MIAKIISSDSDGKPQIFKTLPYEDVIGMMSVDN